MYSEIPTVLPARLFQVWGKVNRRFSARRPRGPQPRRHCSVGEAMRVGDRTKRLMGRGGGSPMTGELRKLLRRDKRQLAFQVLNLWMIVLSSLVIWKTLVVATKSESPVVVVLRCATAKEMLRWWWLAGCKTLS